MSELKLCPFCGGKAKQYLSVLSWVECEKCGAKTPQYQFDNQSIDAWNNRASGWIPATERLPEKGRINPITKCYQKYICSLYFADVNEYDVRCIAYDKKGRWWYGGMDFTDCVVAWQPLPEGYEGEDK